MAQIPQIKPELNESKRDRKKAGLFARVFGGGSTGGTVGVGTFGGTGGGLGGVFGGLMATKAGLTLAVAMGVVALGIVGLVGYRLLAGNSDQPSGDNLSLFAPKPKEDASPEVKPVPSDGSSDSLRFLAQANAVPGSPELPQAAAPADEVAAGAAGAPAAASDAGGHAGDVATGNGVNKNLLKTAGKIGELTKTTGSGGPAVSGGRGSSAGAANLAAAAAGAAANASARAGSLSAMKKGMMVAGGSSRGIAGQRGASGALKQALGALSDNRNAQTSYEGGHTYDGSTAAGGNNIGPDGGLIGSGGPGTAAGAAQPTSLPNAAATPNDPQAPPTPTATDAAPWQNAIKTAQALIGVAVLLLLISNFLAKTPHGRLIVMVIAAVVASLGAMVIALGAQIATGQWGQKLQGGVLAAAGTGLIIAAAAAAFGGGNKANASGMNVDGAVADDSSAASGAGGASGGAGGAGGSGSGGMLSGINPFVLIGGGLGLIGLCGSMMSPPAKYPSSDFQNGNPPDTHWFGYRESPSDLALEKYLV